MLLNCFDSCALLRYETKFHRMKELRAAVISNLASCWQRRATRLIPLAHSRTPRACDGIEPFPKIDFYYICSHEIHQRQTDNAIIIMNENRSCRSHVRVHITRVLLD